MFRKNYTIGNMRALNYADNSDGVFARCNHYSISCIRLATKFPQFLVDNEKLREHSYQSNIFSFVLAGFVEV